jgi:hypothetical protein
MNDRKVIAWPPRGYFTRAQRWSVRVRINGTFHLVYAALASRKKMDDVWQRPPAESCRFNNATTPGGLGAQLVSSG